LYISKYFSIIETYFNITSDGRETSFSDKSMLLEEADIVERDDTFRISDPMFG
jgi:hypothetical protein